MDRLLKRDTSALGELYDNYGDAFYGTALRMVRNEELAQEVVQDSFMKIWNSIESYQSKKSRLFTWMINILRNTAIDKLRSRDFKSSEKSDPIDQYVYTINKNRYTELPIDSLGIKDGLKDLKKDQRDIIEWVYFGGYTQSEIAREYGIPLGTVKTRLRSALIELRRIFKID